MFFTFAFGAELRGQLLFSHWHLVIAINSNILLMER